MSVSYEMLLHPELLTNEQLFYIIHERYLRIPNIELMPRDELLELFHQYCVPYGQRKYRDSGRGKILNKSRNLSPLPVVKENVPHNCQTTSPSNAKKMKPPPDLLSGHNMKRIKLEIQSSAVDNEYNIKRKVTNEMLISLATESPPRKKEKKQITWP